MARFKKTGKNTVQQIPTASLPDIIFMLLFFFMVTTTLREVSVKVQMHKPYASEVKKLENKSLVSYIYIGRPIDKKMFGTVPRIQLNDVLTDAEDIREFITSEREKRDENDRKKMTVSLKVDGDTEMGVVTDVKQELRKASALKINYSTLVGDPLVRRDR